MKDKLRRYRTTQEMYEDVTTALDASRTKEDKVAEIDDKTKMIPIVKDSRTETPSVKESSIHKEQYVEKPANKKRWAFMACSIDPYVYLKYRCICGSIQSI